MPRHLNCEIEREIYDKDSKKETQFASFQSFAVNSLAPNRSCFSLAEAIKISCTTSKGKKSKSDCIS